MALDDRDERQREVNARVSAHLPSDMVDSAMPIVIAHDGAVHQWGTGTLFRVGDYHFLVTAAHVIRDACRHGKTLGIGGAHDGRFIALTGNAILYSDDDRLDVALLHLPSDVWPRLSQARFLQLYDIDLGEQSPTAVYSLLGFPAAWSSPSIVPDEALRLKALQYTAYRYNRDTAALAGYQERFHLLLDAQFSQVTDDQGNPFRVEGANGGVADFPELGGISGCSIWRVGDLKIPFDKWSHERARIVAVQTVCSAEQV